MRRKATGKVSAFFFLYELREKGTLGAHRLTYSWALCNQNVAGRDVVMKYSEILKSFYSTDDVTRYSADPIEVKNCSFFAKKVFQS